jgi:hypothetical protein
VNVLLERGADVNLVTRVRDENGAYLRDVSQNRATPLHAACEARHSDIVRALLCAGADMNIQMTVSRPDPSGDCLTTTFRPLGKLLFTLPVGGETSPSLASYSKMAVILIKEMR